MRTPAILYALGYLFERREKAGHHGLTLTLGKLPFLFVNASYRLIMHLSVQSLEKAGKAGRMAMQSEKDR